MTTHENGTRHIWVESLWLTRKEGISLKDGDDLVQREVSLGMTVKCDDRSPSIALYDALERALVVIMEEEKKRWLSEELIRRERRHLKESVSEMDAIIKEEWDNPGTSKTAVPSPEQDPVTEQIKNLF